MHQNAPHIYVGEGGGVNHDVVCAVGRRRGAVHGGGGSRHRAAVAEEEEADVDAAAEETGVERR
jgi:hypothetical protein